MDSPLAIPVKLDAFVLNPDTCDGTHLDQAKISPLQQPNYSYLRMSDSMTRNDVLQAHDLHAAAPSTRNSRVTNLATQELRENRLGVYLHWMIPRPYRSGMAAAGHPPGLSADDDVDPQMPVFPECPNRWLVIRKLVGETVPSEKLDAVQAWVIYSDWMRTIDKIDDTEQRTVDLQVDVAPYLTTRTKAMAQEPSIDEQAEVFIGGRAPATEKTIPPQDRVSLGVMNSSNQLFPDYQPHNSNVFSMLDTFEYSIQNKTAYVEEAVANYYVLGWHEDPEQDLLHLGPDTSRGDRLGQLSMTLADATEPEVAQWLESTTGSRILCHGAMYGVRWHSRWNPETKPVILADAAAEALSKRVPVALGTTPLDALLAYVDTSSTDMAHILSQLGALLRAQEESIESRRAAADEVQNYSFEKTAGGTRYVLQPDLNNPGQPPGTDAASALEALNREQTLYDATARQLRQAKWDLFAIWWRYVTELGRNDDAYRVEVREALNKHIQLEQVQTRQATAVQTTKKVIEDMKLDTKEAIAPDFHQQRDPTLFVGEVKAGWPNDYLDPLQVRLDSQIPQYSTAPVSVEFGLDNLPEELQQTATRLVHEFTHYEGPAEAPQAEPETYPPLYHDGRDQWNNTQPWFPLFLEWEAEYYHVPFEEWEMEDRCTNAATDPKFCYRIKQNNEPLWKQQHDDRRTVSGRILLLPQPVFSLHAQVERLFDTVTDEEIDPIIPKDERDDLLKEIRKLPFISAPLGGFTDHLTTVADGNHVKPTIRYPGKQPKPLKEAYEQSKEVGLDKDALQKVGAETGLTPYGSLVRLEALEYSAFKPVAHGQFRLTKLNVIDKFGQAVAAIDPTRRVDGPPPLSPHIGEYYRPQAYKKTGEANIIIEPKKPGDCPFIQVPPAITQPVRLHMNWVQLENPQGEYLWRPVTEWENPIWGWVLVNYVNYGIQLFLPDGMFYREVRMAAPNHPPGAVASAQWLPFQPPDDQPTEQLDHLIQQFTEDQSYLLGFMNMINTATENARSVPGAYSQCVNSLIGRPLALANAGFSLELAEDARKNQSTVGKQPDIRQPMDLLEPSEHQYEFAVKLGDALRPHDGLVGYFRAKEQPQPTDALVLDQVYTPFPNSTPEIQPIDGESFLRLKSFWLNPAEYHTEDASERYRRDCNRKLTVCGLLVDPFTPVNAYSSILPVEPLALAPWTWESALLKMTAFFHFGPLLVEDDVPAFNPEKQLKADYDLETDEPAGKIKLPALAAAEWNWLQPYDKSTDPGAGADDQGVAREEAVVPGMRMAGSENDDEEQEAYMALSVGNVDPVPQFAAGPLTAVEGFLQMKRPITAAETE